jgi:hypothetical protein
MRATALPPPIDLLAEHGNPMPYGVIAAPNGGQTEDFPYLAIVDLLADPGETAPFSQRNIFFMGFAKYADIFRNRFILGFCFFFDRNGQRWILAGGDTYNYCRPDDGPPPPGWYQPTADTQSVRGDVYRAIRKSEE